jgi:hypothetical protein
VSELRLRSAGLTWREVDGELIVLDLDRSVYLASNGTGTALWHALSRGATHQALIDIVVGRFGASPVEAAGDVDEFVGRLSDLGLLEG